MRVPEIHYGGMVCHVWSFVRCALAFSLLALLQACGGGGGAAVGNGAVPGSSAIVVGVAATGLAINGNVTLKDSTGVTRTAVISQPDGAFSIDVGGLAPPYFLKASDMAGSLTLYSIASGAGNFNINPLTHLTVVAAAMSVDPAIKTPDAVFDNPSRFAGLTHAQIEAAASGVMAEMSPSFQAALSANGAGGVNPLTDAFQIGNGLDVVFDNYVVTLDNASGEVRERRVANGTTTVLGLVDKLGMFPAAGIYDGTVTVSPVLGGGVLAVRDVVITPSGEMRYVLGNGVMVSAAVTVSGAGATGVTGSTGGVSIYGVADVSYDLIAMGDKVTGAGKIYAPTGGSSAFVFSDGSTVADLSITGTIYAGTFYGTVHYDGLQDAFSFSLNTPQTGNPASLDKIAGTYVASSDSSTVFIGHIEADGKIWGSGPGIGYSGLVQVVDHDANLYRITLAYSENGTYGHTSGLATFHDAAPDSVALPGPVRLAPEGYTGEVSGLNVIQSAAGNQGMLVMLPFSASRQMFWKAVRVSSQQQTVILEHPFNSLMVQAVGIPEYPITSSGDIQYSSSAAAVSLLSPISGSSVLIITNPGSIVQVGPDEIALPLPSAIGFSLNSLIGQSSLLPMNEPLPSLIVNWQSFNIDTENQVNFGYSSSSIALSRVTVSDNSNVISGTLASNGQIFLTNSSGVVVGGNVVLNGLIATSGVANAGAGLTLVSGNPAE